MPNNFVNPWPQFFGVSDYAGNYLYFGDPNTDPVANPRNVNDLDGVSLGNVVQLNSRGAPTVPVDLVNPPYSMVIYTDLVGNGGAAVPDTYVKEFWGASDPSGTASTIWESVSDTQNLDNVAKLAPAAGNAAIVLNNTQFRVGDETSNEEFFQTEGVDTFVSSALVRKNKNYLINAQGLINQEGVSGSVVLAAGEYGHDGFKGGSGGCTYTFSTTNNVTTFTITAGTLVQEIVGEDLHSGSVVLSWTGDAQAQINGGGFAASPLTGTAIGGTNLTVEWDTTGAGTLSLPQLEYGPNASDFEYKSYDEYVKECQFFFRKSYNLSVAPGTVAGDGNHNYVAASTASDQYSVNWEDAMYAAPTVTLYSTVTGNSGQIRKITATANDIASSVNDVGQHGFVVNSTHVDGSQYAFQYTADARP